MNITRFMNKHMLLTNLCGMAPTSQVSLSHSFLDTINLHLVPGHITEIENKSNSNEIAGS
jgi:hypothetical protein